MSPDAASFGVVTLETLSGGVGVPDDSALDDLRGATAPPPDRISVPSYVVWSTRCAGLGSGDAPPAGTVYETQTDCHTETQYVPREYCSVPENAAACSNDCYDFEAPTGDGCPLWTDPLPETSTVCTTQRTAVGGALASCDTLLDPATQLSGVQVRVPASGSRVVGFVVDDADWQFVPPFGQPVGSVYAVFETAVSPVAVQRLVWSSGESDVCYDTFSYASEADFQRAVSIGFSNAALLASTLGSDATVGAPGGGWTPIAYYNANTGVFPDGCTLYVDIGTMSCQFAFLLAPAYLGDGTVPYTLLADAFAALFPSHAATTAAQFATCADFSTALLTAWLDQTNQCDNYYRGLTPPYNSALPPLSATDFQPPGVGRKTGVYGYHAPIALAATVKPVAFPIVGRVPITWSSQCQYAVDADEVDTSVSPTCAGLDSLAGRCPYARIGARFTQAMFLLQVRPEPCFVSFDAHLRVDTAYADDVAGTPTCPYASLEAAAPVIGHAIGVGAVAVPNDIATILAPANSAYRVAPRAGWFARADGTLRLPYDIVPGGYTGTMYAGPVTRGQAGEVMRAFGANLAVMSSAAGGDAVLVAARYGLGERPGRNASLTSAETSEFDAGYTPEAASPFVRDCLAQFTATDATTGDVSVANVAVFGIVQSNLIAANTLESTTTSVATELYGGTVPVYGATSAMCGVPTNECLVFDAARANGTLTSAPAGSHTHVLPAPDAVLIDAETRGANITTASSATNTSSPLSVGVRAVYIRAA